jgi:hypothetical protein
MERGALALARTLLLAFVMGLAVAALHPSYRDTLRNIRRGTPERSAIWLSNQAYYPEIRIAPEPRNDHAE